jgi:uncharacterized membrane protein YvlD (DUF360 family)
MKALLVKILGTMGSFYAAAYFIHGFHIDSTWQTYLATAIVFLLFNLLITPLVKLLLLPINLLTLGLLRWLTNVLVLYLFDLLYDGIRITGYQYAGLTTNLLILPPMYISLFWTLVLTSFVMSLTYSLITSLFQGE